MQLTLRESEFEFQAIERFGSFYSSVVRVEKADFKSSESHRIWQDYENLFRSHDVGFDWFGALVCSPQKRDVLLVLALLSTRNVRLDVFTIDSAATLGTHFPTRSILERESIAPEVHPEPDVRVTLDNLSDPCPIRRMKATLEGNLLQITFGGGEVWCKDTLAVFDLKTKKLVSFPEKWQHPAYSSSQENLRPRARPK